MGVRKVTVSLVVPLLLLAGFVRVDIIDYVSGLVQTDQVAKASPEVDAAVNSDAAPSLLAPEANTGVSVAAPVVENLPKVGIVAKTSSKAWDQINFNSRKLINNVWGAPTDEALTSGIFLNENSSFGWFWDRKNPKPRPGEDMAKPLYPSIRVGGCPWEASSTVYFPVKIRDIKTLQLEVDYSYPLSPTGYYNLTYDIFLSDTNKACSEPKPNAEIMVWLHHTFPQPPETYKGDFSDGTNIYGLYSFVMSNGRQYYSFELKDQSRPQTRHTVDVRKLIDNLKLDPDWYAHGIELGNEIISGSGRIEISKFAVNLNGRGI